MQTRKPNNDQVRRLQAVVASDLGLTPNAKHKVTRMAEMFVKVDRTELQDSRSRVMVRQLEVGRSRLGWAGRAALVGCLVVKSRMQ